MADLYMDCGHVVCDWLSDKLTALLCIGILFAGLWQMDVFRIELLP